MLSPDSVRAAQLKIHGGSKDMSKWHVLVRQVKKIYNYIGNGSGSANVNH